VESATGDARRDRAGDAVVEGGADHWHRDGRRDCRLGCDNARDRRDNSAERALTIAKHCGGGWTVCVRPARAETAAGVTTAYTLDLASSLPQVLTETSGSAITSYAYAGGPLELDQSGATNWYLTDTLGSVRLVTDSTGASPATYDYSAFGSTRTSSGSLANEVRFSGERTDTESGLEFLRARTYDPSVGTFLQRDSWGITARTSSGDGSAYSPIAVAVVLLLLAFVNFVPVGLMVHPYGPISWVAAVLYVVAQLLWLRRIRRAVQHANQR
jgi:RHS repeat-associated protein